jgi:hypothetical protein
VLPLHETKTLQARDTGTQSGSCAGSYKKSAFTSHKRFCARTGSPPFPSRLSAIEQSRKRSLASPRGAGRFVGGGKNISSVVGSSSSRDPTLAAAGPKCWVSQEARPNLPYPAMRRHAGCRRRVSSIIQEAS